MPTNRFDKLLKEYEDVDIEKILAKLGKLHPDNSLLPPSHRCDNQTEKAPTGPFDREHLIEFMRDQAAKEKDWDEAVPYEKKTRGRVFVPKEAPVKAFSERDLAEMGTDSFFNQGMRGQSREEIAEQAAALGISFGTLYSDIVGGFSATAKSELIKAIGDEPPNATDVNDSIRKLEANSGDLKEINLNNLREISVQDWDRLWLALGKNTNLKVLQAAGCGLSDVKAAGLISALESNKSLEKICLDSNNLSGKYFVKLFTAIGNQGRVRELRLSNQRPGILGYQIEMEILRLVQGIESLIRLGIDLQVAEAKVRVQDRIQRNMDQARLARST